MSNVKGYFCEVFPFLNQGSRIDKGSHVVDIVRIFQSNLGFWGIYIKLT